LRILIGNKTDIEEKRVISNDEGKELSKQYYNLYNYTNKKVYHITYNLWKYLQKQETE